MIQLADLSRNRGLPVAAAREGSQDFSEHQTSSSSTKRKKRKRTKRNRKKNAPKDSGLHQSSRPTRDLSVPLKARINEGKIRVSHRLVKQPDGTPHRVQYLYAVARRTRSCRTKNTRTHSETPSTDCPMSDASSATRPSDQIHTVDGDDIPSLHSDEYIFDPSEYKRWEEMHAFNFDGAASHLNTKCRDFASKEKSFLSLTARDLQNKTIWLCPPVAEAAEIISHFEKIRQAQPESTSAVLVLPKYTSPGADYRHLLTKYVQLHTYWPGTYLFQTYNPDTLEKIAAPPISVPYDVWCADEFASDTIYDQHLQSLHDRENTNRADAIPTEPASVPVPKPSYKSHQARYETPLNYQTCSSAADDLLIIACPTPTDSSLQGLVDSGATKNFCSDDYVRAKRLTTHTLDKPLRVRLADGSLSIARQGVHISYTIGDKSFRDEFIVTRLSGTHSIILGYSWLKQYNPSIDWTAGTLGFSDENPIAAVIQKRTADMQFISAKQMARVIQKEQKRTSRLNTIRDPYETPIQLFTGSLRLVDPTPNAADTAECAGVQGWDDTADVQQKINEVQTDYDSDTTEKLRTVLRKHSAALKPLLKLPVQRPDYDMSIDFDGPIPHARVYRMSPAELEELKVQLEDYLSRGWIRPSNSEFSSGVLFAVKPGTNKLRMCIDFRQLNRYTKRIAYALPNIDNILDKLGQNACFSALDLASGYHQLRIKDYPAGNVWNSRGEEVKGSDVHKTAFTCQYGTYEFLVMPFGLTGAPSTYQRFINSILDPVRRPYLQVYLDDILIFSRNEKEHIEHVQEVMRLLEENELYVRSEKCQWMKKSLDYLGFTVQGSTPTNRGGITPSEKKIKAVTDWAVPMNVRDVQSFLGFLNFYRRFIPDFASTAEPLYSLCEKNTPFYWSTECNHAFRLLKQRLTTAPLLVSPRTGPDESFVISTDASNKGLGAVLLQEQPDGTLRPCQYYAKTLNKAQRNYPIYDQELLAIAAALTEFRPYIEGSKSFVVLTDHRPLCHLPTQPKIGRRHVPWVTLLSQYMNYMTIVYRKGSENDSDALSRRSDLMDLTEESIKDNPDLERKFHEYDAGIFERQIDELRIGLSAMVHLQFDDEITKSIAGGYQYDKAFNTGITLPPGVQHDPSTGLYWLADKIYVPNVSSIKSRIISEFHATTGHADSTKTAASILRTFCWPSVKKDTHSYIKLCPTCQRIKPRPAKPYGSLMPLPVPTRPWESVSLDLITGLPTADGYDAIVTFVCSLTKMAHFVPCASTINARQLARVFLDNVYRLHGLPRFLIGDRDPRYTSKFFQSLMSDLRTTLSLSTAYHPQSDGQTERVHRTIEQILRSYVHTNHDGWLEHLSLAEFSYNNNVHSSTEYSPFMANCGFHPRTPINMIDPPFESKQRAGDILDKLYTIHRLIADQLKIAKEVQKHYADKRTKPMEFEVGDRVMLSTQNLKLLNQPSKKFRSRFIGPYEIIKKLSSQAYHLKLPSSMKVHPVFHINLLKSYHSLSPDTDVPDDIPAANDYIYGDDIYYVESIIDHKIAPHLAKYPQGGSALLFRVRWEGYGPKDDTWEPYVNLKKTDPFQAYIRRSDKFRLLLASDEFKLLSRKYPSRFPRTQWLQASSMGPGGM